MTENITLSEFDTDKYFYGVFPNNYGIEKQPSEVFVNVDGALKKATAVFANIDGTLTPVPTLLSSEIKTEAEQMRVYKFTPTADGNYTIKVKRATGDHEIRLYDSDFKPMTDSYFINRALHFPQALFCIYPSRITTVQIQAKALCRFTRRFDFL